MDEFLRKMHKHLMKDLTTELTSRKILLFNLNYVGHFSLGYRKASCKLHAQ